MTQLERACLNFFVTDYQRIILQIENHQKYLEEVQGEINRLGEEEERLHRELAMLDRQKEIVINKFADAFLANGR